ncbi:MAG: UTP--glucose-1-phosphate uridylyltransferase [Calditrichaeota bacterium]|nr:MAG: UTP--glucose-1-phosphate uridylyltransferase [Calditrichota bacterium]
MTFSQKKFEAFAQKMEKEGLPQVVTNTFEFYYKKLVIGETGMISENEIQAVKNLPDSDSFSEEFTEFGKSALPKTILLKLNGGLGTSMGLSKAKSLLEVKNGLTFLDIIAKQAIKSEIPLVLMNSFNTSDDSLEALESYTELKGKIPLDFLQHKIPKIKQEDFTVANCEENPNLEWCPPGHGNIYTALVTSGMLDTLLDSGFEYAFVSNSDNLGAVMDEKILGYFAKNNFPFMMECADRTEADKKGGHLAKYSSGQLILRESAQCPKEDLDFFQNINLHRYFNTNSLWIHLPSIKKLMEANDNVLELPMIRNSKTVDPKDSSSTPVYQLETAMGSAIALIENSAAIRVPRTRFAPVKTTNDLLAVRSDAYILTDDFEVIGNPERKLGQILVNLDSKYYKLINEMESRIPHTPSLLECEKLTVKGDVKFGKNVVVKGEAEVVNDSENQIVIKDDSVLP